VSTLTHESLDSPRLRVARAPQVVALSGQGITWFDVVLVLIFMAGLYTAYTIQITATVPFPSAPSGVAGVALLWRRRRSITTNALLGFFGVLLIYIVSILLAPNLTFLPRRFNGLVQLTYSIAIGYGLFLTLIRATRQQIAAIFLTLSLLLLVGCLLESYGGLRPLSDAVREKLYSRGLYENDLRDTLFYGRPRPKFFASEPASVTFCYALFMFVWFVVSRWSLKIYAYIGLMAVGIVAMPGPTLLLMLLLLLPYMLFLASRRNGRFNPLRFTQVAVVAALAGMAFVVLAQVTFPERFKEASGGQDASFFYRIRGPAIAGVDAIKNLPFGAGLTGETYIADHVVNLYVQSPGYSSSWKMVHPASELIINYFWSHWLYLGPFFGIAAIAAITLWLRVLHVPSPAFCWLAWAVLGQASGAYVGPACWAVLFMAAAAAVIHQRRDAETA
jgi:hypothetical protein